MEIPEGTNNNRIMLFILHNVRIDLVSLRLLTIMSSLAYPGTFQFC